MFICEVCFIGHLNTFTVQLILVIPECYYETINKDSRVIIHSVLDLTCAKPSASRQCL